MGLSSRATNKEPELLIESKMSSPLTFEGLVGNTVAFSTPAPYEGRENEDAAAMLCLGSRGTLLIVADGLGGSRDGKAASSLAVNCVSASLNKAIKNPEIPTRAAILDGIEEANRQIRELGTGAGSTLAIVHIENGIARPYHIGDSMILVVGQQGKEKFLNTWHSPVGYALEAGLIDSNEAMTHEERHIVSNFVGSQDMWMDIGPEIQLSKRDTILISSDGLSDNLTLEEISACIRKGPLEDAASELIKRCNKLMNSDGAIGKPDDLTFIIHRPQYEEPVA